MRNIFIALFIAFGALFSAQNISKKDFIQKVNQLNIADDYQDLTKLEEDFVKIYKEDKQRPWKAYYYAALSRVVKAKIQFENGSLESTYRELDVALKYLTAIDMKSKKNVEIKSLLGITYLLGSKFNNAKKDDFIKRALGYSKIANQLSSKNKRAILLSDLVNGAVDAQKELKDTESKLSISWGKELLGDLINKK